MKKKNGVLLREGTAMFEINQGEVYTGVNWFYAAAILIVFGLIGKLELINLF